MNHGSVSNASWLYDSPVYSDVEAKLRRFLLDLAKEDKIIGIQVCAYKDGQVIIDTAAGVLGKDDPRPVQPDSLFPVFSTTKGITAGLVHWLADKGKLKLDDYVANIWPEFDTNGKDKIKVYHILNHTSGLHNVPDGITEDSKLFCDYDECLKRVAMAAPETEPGRGQIYQYLSFGWLCSGVIEHATGKKFQDVLEEAFIRPLNLEGELYIGIPPGAESRVATLSVDTDELNKMGPNAYPPGSTVLPSSFTHAAMSNLIALLNTLDGRRAIVPGVNGHFSARAVARYYACLVDGGVVPPHHPNFTPEETKQDTADEVETKIFINPKEKIHEAFLAAGDYKDFDVENAVIKLGFIKYLTSDGCLIGFGHAGLGGTAAYCDISNRFAICLTLNKLSTGALTGEVIRFICSELDLPVPRDYANLKAVHM